MEAAGPWSSVPSRPGNPSPVAAHEALPWAAGDRKLSVYLTNLSTTRLKTASGIRKVR